MANDKQQKPEKTEPVKTEILAPRPMSGDSQQAGLSELEQLRAENERLHEERRAFEAAARAAVEKMDEPAKASGEKPVPADHFKNAKGQVVAEKFRGPKHYEAGETLFVDGKFLRTGERFTAIDTTPGRGWVPLVPKTEPELVRAEQPSPNTQTL